MPERLGTEPNVGSEERLPEMTTTLTEVDGPDRKRANVGRSDPVKPQHDIEQVSVDNVQGRLMHENSVGADAGRKRRLPEQQGHDRVFPSECFPTVDGQRTFQGLETSEMHVAVGDGTTEQTYMNVEEFTRWCVDMVNVSWLSPSKGWFGILCKHVWSRN